MDYKLFISDESRIDIIDAYSWYEVQREGLGKDFELCLEAAFNTIIRNPLASQVKYKDLRICYIQRFPFGIHYIVEKKEIRVFGVFHTSRSPNSWGDRL